MFIVVCFMKRLDAVIEYWLRVLGCRNHLGRLLHLLWVASTTFSEAYLAFFPMPWFYQDHWLIRGNERVASSGNLEIDQNISSGLYYFVLLKALAWRPIINLQPFSKFVWVMGQNMESTLCSICHQEGRLHGVSELQDACVWLTWHWEVLIGSVCVCKGGRCATWTIPWELAQVFTLTGALMLSEGICLLCYLLDWFVLVWLKIQLKWRYGSSSVV